MRYAVISDIHANFQAWNAVYQDILNVGVDEILCLGDLVGYGPDPGRVIESCHANVHHFVLGNHDAAVCKKMKLQRFNRDSRRIIEWTHDQLDSGSLRFLSELPLVVGGENAVFAHASVNDPANFDYLYQPQDCAGTWEACEEQVAFIGHTHISGIHMIGEMGIPQWLPPQNLRLTKDIRYVVNVGSIGQPRDGDTRACYVVYDSQKMSVEYRRVPYSFSEYMRSLKQKNVPVHPCMIEGSSDDPMMQIHPGDMPPVMGDGSGVQPLGQAIAEESKRAGTGRLRSQRLTGRNNAVTGRQGALTGRQGALTGRQASITGRQASVTGRHVASTGRMRVGAESDGAGRQVVDRAAQTHYGTRMPKQGSSTGLIMIVIGMLLVGAVVAALIVMNNKIAQAQQQINTPPVAQPTQPAGPVTINKVTKVTTKKSQKPKRIRTRKTTKGPARAQLGQTVQTDAASGKYVGDTNLLFGDARKDDESQEAEW